MGLAMTTVSPNPVVSIGHAQNIFSPAHQQSGRINAHTGFDAQLEAVTATGQADMLLAARLEDELNRAQAIAKLLEAGPKAAKDLLA